MITLKLADSRTIRITSEVLWEYGRVVYRVDKVGSFSLHRNPYGEIDDSADSIHLAYGRVDTEREPFRLAAQALPDAPVINGVTISGGCGFNPDKMLEALDSKGRHSYDPFLYSWPVQRVPLGGVSDVVRKRVKYICIALAAYYLECPEYQAIERARARHLAPGMLRKHQVRINELRQEIRGLDAELAEQLVMADRVADLTAPTDALASTRR